MKASLVLMLTVIVGSSTTAAHAQNYVTNPEFDQSILGWTPFTDIGNACTWNGVEGDPAAGSASCIGASPSGYTGLTQCLNIPTARIDATVLVTVAALGGGAALTPQSTAACGETGPAGWMFHDEGSVDAAHANWHVFKLRFLPMDTPWIVISISSGGVETFFDHVVIEPSETVFKSRFECDTDTYLDCE